MPTNQVRAFIDQMDSILAEEALIQVERQQVGSGMMKKQDADRALNNWRKKAGMTERKPANEIPGFGNG
jgi:hypothetical protein